MKPVELTAVIDRPLEQCFALLADSGTKSTGVGPPAAEADSAVMPEDAARGATGLGSAFRGRVILPDARDYERARRVHNAAMDRHPALIVRPTDADDVALVVAHTQERGLPLVVRAGGHNMGATARATAPSSWTCRGCATWRSTPLGGAPGPTPESSPANTRTRPTRLGW